MQLIYSLLTILNEMSPYILLGFLIAGVINAFVSPSAMTRHLSGSGWKSVVKAALIGIPLPLCSCGVLPTAISLRRNGASKAATTSFLIATPQTGVDSIAATWSLLGGAFAIMRPLAALVTSFFGGLAVGKTEKTDRQKIGESGPLIDDERPKSFGGRVIASLRYGFIDMVASIGGWLVAGLIIAALITVYVPDDFFSAFGRMPLLSMLAAVIVAVPMYVCATGSIPIALSLILKGLSPGTAFVLLMAGPAANFASFTLISKEMGRKSALVYLASIVVGAISFGLIIDYLLPAQWFAVNAAPMHHCHATSLPIFPTICSAILVGLLIYSFINRLKHRQLNTTAMTKNYIIEGMNCQHCRASVDKAIRNVAGVTDVNVDLASKRAEVEGSHNAADLIEAVRNAGFDAKEA